MLKVASFKIKAMQRDLSVSAFNSEYAYENKNVRIMSTNDNTLLSIINEKGTLLKSIIGIGESIKGTPIGLSVIDNELIIFSCGDKDINLTIDAEELTVNDIAGQELNIEIDNPFDDRIYKVLFDNSSISLNISGKLLFKGDLGFNYKYPIETLPFYENSDIKKVYWTDGLNLPRVINVADTVKNSNKWNNTSFNFVRSLALKEVINISKNSVSSGLFAAGTILYAFTYFDKYGQESNIFYTSPLYYTSYKDRGASPEDSVNNSFNIEILNVDTNFDYLRIYSILRTSNNAVPYVKKVVDLAIPTDYVKYNENYYTRYTNIERVKVLRNNDKEYVSILDILENSGLSTADYKIWTLSPSDYIKISFTGSETFIDFKTLQSNLIILGYTTTPKVIILSLYLFTRVAYDDFKLNFTDNGITGDSVDPTELLYIGGEEVVFGTMTQKDNTLFLGDIEIKRKTLSSIIKNYFKNKTITFKLGKEIEASELKSYYSYNNLLDKSSAQIKTFKYLEYYRFGILALHYTGKWSDPIWINDAKNTIHVNTTFYDNSTIELPIALYTLNNSDIIKDLINNGYVKIRPVIVYPTINDREVICLGILCPTVYNVYDRYSNSPFVQSSWFVRPNAPFDYNRAFYFVNNGGYYEADWCPLGTDKGSSLPDEPIYSRAGVMLNTHKYVEAVKTEGVVNTKTTKAENVNLGAWAEFRHNHPIPSNNKRNAEILCIYNPPEYPIVSNENDESQTIDWVTQNSENYYVDLSIFTMHSPDIEFDDNVKNINTSNLKLRIVGIVPLTSFYSDIDISTSTPVNNFTDSSDTPIGFYKETVGVENDFSKGLYLYGKSHFGWRSLISGAFWFDQLTEPSNDFKNKTTGFVVYPWHRNGSLNNTKYATEGYRSAMLDKKRLSNIRYSYKSVYLNNDNVWHAELDGNNSFTGISGVSIFNSNEVSLIKIPAPKNSLLGDLNYYGNIDKLVTSSRYGDKKDGYPIIISGKKEDLDDGNAHSLFRSNYEVLKETDSSLYKGTDPVRIKYKSTPHAVIALNYTADGDVRILPTISDGIGAAFWGINSGYKLFSEEHLYWDKNKEIKHITQNLISSSHFTGPVDSLINILHGWLWLGELYNDNVLNRFGGLTEEAFENNQWLPCGEPVNLISNEGLIKTSVDIKWTEGDTYYLRYDHIKTYPFTLEDLNQVTDIISFMCETRVNIDGRYDRNRGQLSNFATTPLNFNLLNNVYSLQNNFFNYRYINTNKLNLNTFNNLITWTKTKTAGELTDTWTNITLASTLDFDGNKGNIRALRKFNNTLFAFQDMGISLILYNENTQVSTTEGVPIEIANSGKVNGKRYIVDKVGCTNKWSICETSNGIYFIDDITKGIYLFNGQLNNISDKFGLHSWINKASKNINIWNPIDFDSFVTYYDKVNGDVFFISKDECLAFSEPLGQFASFYSYENTPYFINLEDKGIFINNKKGENQYKLWLHNLGDYNMFFGEYLPFYTTVIANQDMQKDKIFNNIEFRADSWDKNGNLLNTTFDTLTTWNEYQKGIENLINTPNKPSSLKKKFRIWRANIPRDKSNNRDRMRNPWLYLKLSMEKENTNKTILHDMMVYYFD